MSCPPIAMFSGGHSHEIPLAYLITGSPHSEIYGLSCDYFGPFFTFFFAMPIDMLNVN